MESLAEQHARLLPLLKRALRDPDEMTVFIEALGATGEPRRLAMKHRNPDLDENDVIAEWYTQAGLAAAKAKLDVGDPIHFIKWMAQKRVLSFIRSFHINNIVVNCHACGADGQRLCRADGMPSCASCGSGNVTTTRRMVPVDRSIDGLPPLESTLSAKTKEQILDEATFDAEMDDLRRYLIKRAGNQRSRAVEAFDAIKTYVVQGGNRRDVVLKELAAHWGVGQNRMGIIMRRLKECVSDYMAEHSDV